MPGKGMVVVPKLTAEIVNWVVHQYPRGDYRSSWHCCSFLLVGRPGQMLAAKVLAVWHDEAD